jgi:hypothetical protein
MTSNKAGSKLFKKVEEAKNSKKTVVFLAGTCSDGNKWREEVIDKVGEKFYIIDPYDKKWKPEDNIYDELSGINTADLIIFYKPGKLAEKEKKFLEISGKKYKEFDTVAEIVSFLDGYKKKKSISAYLKDLAFRIESI